MQDDLSRQLRRMGVKLPPIRVGDADPYDLGVFQSKLAELGRPADAIPPYVKRPAVDNELTVALQGHSLVLVVGPPKSGKSRAAFEAVSRQFRDRVLLAATPDRERRLFETLAELPRLDQLDGDSDTGLLIWIDDGGALIQTGDLGQWTVAALQDLYQGQVTIIVTTVDAVLDGLRFSPELEVSSRTSQLLRSPLVTVVDVPPALEPEELEEAKREYPLFRDDPLLGRLAGFLAAVQILKSRYDERKHVRGTDIAFIQAARDWRRAGMPDYISVLNLRALAEMYAARLNPGSSLADQFDAALQWATDPTESGAPMLEQNPSLEEPRSFRVFDALYEQIKTEDGSVPDPTWLFVLDQMRVADLEGVLGAAIRADRHDYAIRAARKVAHSSAPEAPAARLVVAALQEQCGDFAGAKAEYERLLDHQDAAMVASAHISLGFLQQRQQVFEEADSHFEQARALAPRPDLAAVACLGMAGLQHELGHADAEELWMLRAVQAEGLNYLETVIARSSYCDIDLSDFLPYAYNDVLAIGMPAGLDERGMPIAGSFDTGQRGSESDLLHFDTDDESIWLPVYSNLFWLRSSVSQQSEWAKYSALSVNGAALLANADEEVAVSINPWTPLEYILPARLELAQRSPGLATITSAVSLVLAGETVRAAQLLAIEEVAAQAPAAQAVGHVLECSGQADMAMLWYRCMIASRHQELSLLGDFLVARQLERQGDWEQAIEYYKAAALSGDPARSSQACLLGGQLLSNHDLRDAGQEIFRAALDSGGLSELEKAILTGNVSTEHFERTEAYVFWKPEKPQMEPQDEGTFQLSLTRGADGVLELDAYTRMSGCQDALKARNDLIYYEIHEMPLLWLTGKLIENTTGLRLWVNRNYGPSLVMEAARGGPQLEGDETASPG
jgi:tetratricopeptide (TPR) repeat protein